MEWQHRNEILEWMAMGFVLLFYIAPLVVGGSLNFVRYLKRK